MIMTRARSLPVLLQIAALAFLGSSAAAQSTISRPGALAIARVSSAFSAPVVDSTTLPLVRSPRFGVPAASFALPGSPIPQAHDANYARRGAFIGAVVTGVTAAVVMGHFARRDCEPGLCGSEFGRGALVGGAVGLAAGGVLGWLIGSEIERK
jgi:hypothetical protein